METETDEPADNRVFAFDEEGALSHRPKDKNAEAGPATTAVVEQGPSVKDGVARTYFDEPRWRLDHALNWIACRKIDALTLTPEELLSLRFRSIMYSEVGVALASKNPAHELLTALKHNKLRAIGLNHGELPPEFWDNKSLDLRTWPEVRFRRDDMLREWPDAETMAENGGRQEGAPQAEANSLDAPIDVPHDKLVAFYRAHFGEPGAATNREDMDAAAETHFGGHIATKALTAARQETRIKGRVGRPRKSGK